jgi:hypothetical protein
MRSRPMMITLNDIMYGLHHDIVYRRQIVIYFPLHLNSKVLYLMNLNSVCNNNLVLNSVM